MSTINTIKGHFNGTGVYQMPLLTLTSTASTNVNYLPQNTNTGTTSLIVRVPNQADILGASSPLSPNYNAAINMANRGRTGGFPNGAPGFNSTSFDGRPFKVRVGGVFTVSTSSTTSSFIVNLFQGVNTTTVATLTTASVALATGGGSGNFLLEATLLWDSVSANLTGYSINTFGFGGTSSIVTTTHITGTTAVTTPAGLSFLCGVSAGTALVGGVTVQATEFSIDEL